MRIRLLWFDPIDPCGTTNYGEVEDYTITVADSPRYCEAWGGCSEHIARVRVGAIDNASDCDGYASYTALSTEMAIGSEYDITVTVGDPYDDQDQGGIWVDWNRDGDFEDEAETIAVEGSPAYGPYTATITPPEGQRWTRRVCEFASGGRGRWIRAGTPPTARSRITRSSWSKARGARPTSMATAMWIPPICFTCSAPGEHPTGMWMGTAARTRQTCSPSSPRGGRARSDQRWEVGPRL